MNRVVVTGIGVVSPVGSSIDEFWSALVEARSGIGPITIIPTERLTARVAAQVLDFNPDAHFEPRQSNVMDRFAQFAVVAARSAVADAKLEIGEALALDIATIIGTGVGGQNTQDSSYFRLYGQNAAKLHPLTITCRWTSASRARLFRSRPPVPPVPTPSAKRFICCARARRRSPSPAALTPA
jgi:nodulation protein E